MNTAPSDPVIEVRGLTKRFGQSTVVDNFDMTVPCGAIYGFLGPNGSGKTTTIRMMCGLLTPDGGTGTCLGHDIITEAAAIKAKVGYMTQRFSLYEDLSIRENLEFIARMFGVRAAGRRVAETLADLGLSEREGQLAGTLSGGWKQRLALAACLLHEPELLLLDEPTAGVDPKARRDFWDQIRTLTERGVTVLVSTHYMDEAVQCDFIAYIAYGHKLIDGPAEDIPDEVGLTTWRVEGGDITELARALRGRDGVDQVAQFGTSLHTSGTDGAALDAATLPFRDRPGQYWERGKAGLEEVFIHLMGGVDEAPPAREVA